MLKSPSQSRSRRLSGWAGSSLWSLDTGTSFNLAVYQIILCASLGLSVWVSRDPKRILKHVFWMFVAVVAVNLAFVVMRPPGPIGHQGSLVP